ncbi:PE-PPE domain-containing protein [Mycolicibacterium baixiangningiae]|uniref:PE-PPE domain-containing protein n=1 Tax=Mycolicibacterium baixiangningiae TaxID=2761578 RepID=UPI001E2FA778|nr:PE-PPE domain-containing protein [Mycolicibacterium baixiangningiae]
MKRRSKKIAAIGAATVTATALTVGVSPAPKAEAASTRASDAVDLAADFRLFPPPQAIPDLTFGAGQAAYDVKNDFADFVFRSIFENVNLAAFAQAAGVDPQSILEQVLENLPLALLTDPIFVDLLGGITLPLAAALGALPLLNEIPLLRDLLTDGLNAAGLNTIGGLLDIIGLDLSNLGDLTELGERVGVNIVTSGDVFTLLKVLGTDLGWVPTLPNSVADDVDETEYLGIGVDGLLDLVDNGVINIPGLLTQLLDRLGLLNLDQIPDVLKVRAPVVIGAGVGAFAAGMAYQDILAQLPFQPGGTQYQGPEAAPLLGSLTLMPMLLLQNPGRANGGLFARFYPLAGLFGIDTVTPETVVSNSGGLELPGGLYLGGATLIPVKIDATLQHDWLSDFAAWPNPFSLANSLAAVVAPTYILRGLDAGLAAGSIAGQLGPQIGDAVGGPLEGDPLALDFYVTVPIDALPLLEPTYLIVDAINLLTGANLNNPIGTALGPALSSLVNLGYTDVVRQWNDDGDYWEYVRTFDDSDVPTAFGSFPDVNWMNVPGDVVGALAAGVRQAFDDGLVNRDGPVKNALATLLNLVGLDGGLPGGIGGAGLNSVLEQIRDSIDGVLSGLDLPRPSVAAANAVPDDEAPRISLKTAAPTVADEDEDEDEDEADEASTDDEPPVTDDTSTEIDPGPTDPDDETGDETGDETPAEDADAELDVDDPLGETGDDAGDEDADAGDEDTVDEDTVDEDAGDEDTDAADEDAADDTTDTTDTTDTEDTDQAA